MKQPGFFDLDERYEALSNQGDPLEVLNDSVHWHCHPKGVVDTMKGRTHVGFLAFRQKMRITDAALHSIYQVE